MRPKDCSLCAKMRLILKIPDLFQVSLKTDYRRCISENQCECESEF
jgi:hypothetical protein